MPIMTYTMRLAETEHGVGFFTVQPTRAPDLPAAARYLVDHPFDDFMRRFLLDGVGCLDADGFREVLEQSGNAPAPFKALLFEAAAAHNKFLGFLDRLPGPEELAPHSGLINIRKWLEPDFNLQASWMALFRANVRDHALLPAPGQTGLAPPLDLEAALAEYRATVGVDTVAGSAGIPAGNGYADLPSPAETAAQALARLREADIFEGPELRHQAQLTPVGLMRQWTCAFQVMDARHEFSVRGTMNSYGKGLDLDASRASVLMEVVERASSFASLEDGELPGFAAGHRTVRARYSELAASGRRALDPGLVRLETAYGDEELVWMTGRDSLGDILVPVQFVFLFCNLDEPGYFAGLGSTGLASGNTMEQARVAALHEILERDAEALGFHHPGRCFTLTADHPVLGPLLADYEDKGVHVVFQECATRMGVPAYKSFVVDSRGNVAKGAGANLSGGRALLSALLETTWPYPEGPATRPAPDVPVRRFEDLPDYATGSVQGDLALLEGVLAANGIDPVYVDLTREDLGLPVVKALAPGLELSADFDETVRAGKRLMAAYAETVQGPGPA
jgi:ribosomal protein S12 methylthiotransferase accessory factor YcaO